MKIGTLDVWGNGHELTWSFIVLFPLKEGLIPRPTLDELSMVCFWDNLSCLVMFWLLSLLTTLQAVSPAELLGLAQAYTALSPVTTGKSVVLFVTGTQECPQGHCASKANIGAHSLFPGCSSVSQCRLRDSSGEYSMLGTSSVPSRQLCYPLITKAVPQNLWSIWHCSSLPSWGEQP